MSGHSKWHNIKRRKEAVDAKKGTAFTKFSQEIASAVRQGGADPASNASLRDAIARAKKADFPQINIDRLLGKAGGQNLQSVTYEAFGPGGVGLIISAHTDNTNRTVGQLRTILRDNGGTLGGPNSVLWKFTPHPDDAGFTPKHPLRLDESTKPQLDALLTALNQNPDIEQVFTDAA